MMRLLIIFLLVLGLEGAGMADEKYAAIKVYSYAPPREKKLYKAPIERLTQRGAESVIGTKILKWSVTHGTYGMGGVGFLGFLLEYPDKRIEWMVFTIGFATYFTLVDQHWFMAHPLFYKKQKPLFSYIRSKGENYDWDYVTEKIAGSKIVKIDLQDKAYSMTIEINENQHVIEVLSEDERLSPYPVGGQRKALHPNDIMSDFIIFMEEGGIIDTTENTKPA